MTNNKLQIRKRGFTLMNPTSERSERGFTLMNKASERSERGFTLIELLVVISIIGILAVLVSANLNAARSRARDAGRKSDIRNIATALRLYYNDYGSYPASNNSGNILGCGVAVPPNSICDSGAQWSGGPGPTVYMSTLPEDPLPSQAYFYQFITSDTYTIQACLENKSDTSGIVVDTSWCPSGWGFQVQP